MSAREPLAAPGQEPYPFLMAWRLVERYGNSHEGWWLVFKRGHQVVKFDVHEEAWRAFDV